MGAAVTESQPTHTMTVERDVMVEMRDGTRIAVDVYRPSEAGRYPALLSMSPYGKAVQRSGLPLRPIGPALGNGGQEAGDTEYFVTRGYVHVIADVRGSGDSEGDFDLMGRYDQADGYDLIEWMAQQSWCSGHCGMLGMSYFGVLQLLVALTRPPHLKAIAPYEAYTDYYRHSAYHGGVLSLGHYHQWWGHVSVGTTSPKALTDLPADEIRQRQERLSRRAIDEGFPYLYCNVKHPEKNPRLFDVLMRPYDGPYYRERSSGDRISEIEIPCLFVSRWSGGAIHLPGAFVGFNGVSGPKKMLITETEYPAGPLRPWSDHQDLILRWYDFWLKDIENGVMDGPPIRLLVRGGRGFRDEHEWPLARTEWTAFHLGADLGLSPDGSSEDGTATFRNDPLLGVGLSGPGARFQSQPLERGIEVTGPVSLRLVATIDQPDTTWFATLVDVNPSGVSTPVTRGWLRASHRETTEDPIQPYKVRHPHTRSEAVPAGVAVEYSIDLGETSQLFRPGHRIGLEIKAQDGDAGHFWHDGQAVVTRHDIHCGPASGSSLLLPVIPEGGE